MTRLTIPSTWLVITGRLAKRKRMGRIRTGMGKEQAYSVSSWLADRFPEAEGPLLVHQLDMATSGLLLAAKKSQAHKILQQQFIAREVEKRYVAVLSKPVRE